ncbi:MAG: hypothetical protein ACOCTH_01845 [Halodesulfurarchaeum sp.]
MNRFAGSTRAERESLIEAAIRAHRERKSSFLTVEADPNHSDSAGPAPWMQYRAQDAICNLDCRDGELDSITATVDSLGGITIVEQSSVPEGGTNLRLRIPGDDKRVAQVIETLFIDGFGLSDSFRLWATAI